MKISTNLCGAFLTKYRLNALPILVALFIFFYSNKYAFLNNSYLLYISIISCLKYIYLVQILLHVLRFYLSTASSYHYYFFFFIISHLTSKKLLYLYFSFILCCLFKVTYIILAS